MELICALVIWLGCVFGGMLVMANRGRSAFVGFLLGVLLGPIGLIITLLVSESPEKIAEKLNRILLAKHNRVVNRPAHSGVIPAPKAALRKCPYCAEIILQEAILCKHCGSDLDETRPLLIEKN